MKWDNSNYLIPPILNRKDDSYEVYGEEDDDQRWSIIMIWCMVSIIFVYFMVSNIKKDSFFRFIE